MGANQLLYPPDYVQGATNASATNATVDDAIGELEVEALDTALKQSFNRRDAGQDSALLQNLMVSAIPEVMPLYLRGTQIQSPTALGSKAYLGGGFPGYTVAPFDRTITRFQFSGETMVLLGVKASVVRAYTGTVTDATAGRFVGGQVVTPFGIAGRSVDRLGFADERLTALANVLPRGKFANSGNTGTKVYGYLMGGYNDYWATLVGDIDRYTLATDTASMLGTSLNPVGASAHDGAGNRFNGYLFGGVKNNPSGQPVITTRIVRLAYSNESVTTIANALAVDHSSHAMLGYDVKAYVAGGANNTIYHIDTIEAFTFSGETVAPLSAKLVEGRICCAGVSSSVNGWVVGGSTATTNWAGTNSVDRFTFANETITRIGSVLPVVLADQGALSDYAPGWSY